MNLRRIGIALVASIGMAQARMENLSTPKFDVTSVRLNRAPDLGKGLLQVLPGCRFVATNIPLMQVIAFAWDLPLHSQRLALASGVRMPEDIYDIEAVAEKDACPAAMTTEARVIKMRLMVQALLQDRFQLRIRRELKEQPVYALVVGKRGPRLEKSRFQEQGCGETDPKRLVSNPACHFLDGDQDRGLHGASVTIAQVVEYAQDFTDRPIFDKTALTGFYNIQTEAWAPMKPSLDGGPQPGDAPVNNSDRPTLFEVFEKLGLHLEPQKAAIDTFFIDHVERPSEN